MASLAENREQHIQRFHQQMQEWQEDINRLRAAAYSANSYLQGEMNRLVAQLDKGIQQLSEKLVQVAETGDRKVYSALETLESAWGSMRSNISDMMGRVKSGSAGDTVEKVEQAVKRGASKAKQALNSATQGQGESTTAQSMQGSMGSQAGNQTSQTTVSAQAGRRPSGSTAGQQESQTPGGQNQTRTQEAGASVTVTRTRTSH